MANGCDTVPDALRDRYAQITALTDGFCEKHLDDDDAAAMRELVAQLCCETAAVARGKAESWAAGVVSRVVHAGAYDMGARHRRPTTHLIAEEFGVSAATVMAKSRVIRQLVDGGLPGAPFEVPAPPVLDERDAQWMVEVGGVLLDFREAPRELQVEAFCRGLIPYVWIDRHGLGAGDGLTGHSPGARDVIARIGPDGITPVRDEPPPLAQADDDGAEISPELAKRLAPLVRNLMDGLLSGAFFDDWAPPRAPEGKVYVLRIDLRGARPPIWRRVALFDDTSLAELHDIIQAVMGWHDAHLHCFCRQQPRIVFGRVDSDCVAERGQLDETEYAVCDLLSGEKSRATYEYDFGDSWVHRIELQKIIEPDPNTVYPVCLAGRRACPPENCGGMPTYRWMLRQRSGARIPGADSCGPLPAYFDAERFDLEVANQRLRRAVGVDS